MKNEAIYHTLTSFGSTYSGEIYLTLPQWKRRAFTLRLQPRKKGINKAFLQKLNQLELKATLFAPPEEWKKYAGTLPENVSPAPDLTAWEKWEDETLLSLKKEFEKTFGTFCCGALLNEPPKMEEMELLRKNSFFYAVNLSRSLIAAYPALDPYFMENNYIDGQFEENVLKNFLKGDYYGGVFGQYCLLLTEESLNENKECCNDITSFLEQLKNEEILCMSDEEFTQYNAAANSLRMSIDGSMAENISSVPLYFIANGKKILLAPGETLYMRRKDGVAEPCYDDRNFKEEDHEYNIRKPAAQILSQRDVSSFADGTVFFPGVCRKALSFSYDDGCLQDDKFIAILNKYGMKGTFNLGSSRVLYGVNESGDNWGKIYDGHEVAGHTFCHYSLITQPLTSVLNYLYIDRLVLEKYFHKILCGHAYANGTHAGGTKEIMERLAACGYIYARGSANTMKFDLPENFLLWEQTCHHKKGIIALADEFLALDEKEDLKAFTIWGHVSEFVRENNFDMMEDFCKKISASNEYIWYATNMEICEYVLAVRKLLWNTERSAVKNLSHLELLIADKGKIKLLAPGETLVF